MTSKKPHFPILEAEISKNGLVKKEIAEKIGLTPRAFSRKLTGKSDFWYSEIQGIRKLFPDYSIEQLFSSSDEVRDNERR